MNRVSVDMHEGKRVGPMHAGVHVQFLEIVHGPELAEIWDLYEAAFSEISLDHPCRQTLTRAEFVTFMTNQDVVKCLIYDGAEVVAGSLYTTNLDLIPWISRAYYDKHWPQSIGRRIYAQSFFVRPDHRAKGYLEMLAQAVRDWMLSADITVAFCDFGGRNEISFRLILRSIGAKSLGELGTQRYDAIVLNHE